MFHGPGNPGHSKKVLIDFTTGLILILFFAWPNPNLMIIMIAVIGSILPDFLHGMCFSFKIKWLEPHLAMHHKIHSFRMLSFKQGVLAIIVVSLVAIWVLTL